MHSFPFRPTNSAVLRLQTIILDLLAAGESANVTAEVLCGLVEEVGSRMACAILVEREMGLMHTLAGPRLPTALRWHTWVDPRRAADLDVAANLHEPVIVVDLATDRRWRHEAGWLLAEGFRALWSTPIRSGQDVLGAVVFCFPESRGPTETESEIMAILSPLCAIAIGRTPLPRPTLNLW
jgi:GAF domain-containing protein